MFEKVLEAVFHAVMGPSTGPDIPLFKTFQNMWGTLDKESYCTFSSYAASKKALGSCAKDIIEFATTHIQVKHSQVDKDIYMNISHSLLTFKLFS